MKMNVFTKCLIGCVIVLLVGSLLLCFEVIKFLMPFAVTLMVSSCIGISVSCVLYVFDKCGYFKRF